MSAYLFFSVESKRPMRLALHKAPGRRIISLAAGYVDLGIGLQDIAVIAIR